MAEPRRPNYKTETAILFEYLDALCDIAGDAVGLLPQDAEETRRLRAELDLLKSQGGPLARADLRALHEARRAAK